MLSSESIFFINRTNPITQNSRSSRCCQRLLDQIQQMIPNIIKLDTSLIPQFFKMDMIQNFLAHGEHQHHTAKIFNPNWDEAQSHKRASQVGYNTQEGSSNICWCCFQQIQKKKIPLNQNTKELEFLGFGFPLFYAFVRNCIFLLIVTICSYNVISLYQAIHNNRQFCHGSKSGHAGSSTAAHSPTGSHPVENDHSPADSSHHPIHYFSSRKSHASDSGQHPIECTSWMVDVARVQKTVTQDQALIRIVSFVIHLMLLVYIRDKLVKLKDYFDQRTASPSDFSIMVKNMPFLNNPRRELVGNIQQDFGMDQSNIAEIIFIPDLKQFEEMEQEKHLLTERLREKAKNNEMDEQHRSLEQQIHFLESEMHRFIHFNKDLYTRNCMPAEKAILIMNTQQEKEDLLDKYEDNDGFSSKNFKGVKMTEAPEPKEIIWENISLSRPLRARLTVMGWGLSALVLLILTVVFAVVSTSKSKIVEGLMSKFRHNNDIGAGSRAFLLVMALIFFVVLFNKIVISNLFHKFTDIERHRNTHKFQFSFCLKYCLGLFFTTALMTLIVEAFILGNYYKHDYGVIEEETIMYIINSLFVPIFWAINPMFLYRKFMAWRNKNSMHFTQQQANKMLEYPEYDVGKRYGEVLEIVWFTYLYMTLIPIGGFLSCLGLALYYWIDKYNLLRRSSMHSHVSGNLIYLTLNMLDFTLVLRVAGEILFDIQIRDGAHLFSWICLGVALLYQFLPIESIINFFNHETFKSESMRYPEASQKFTSTYYDEHVLFSHIKQDRDQLGKGLIAKVLKQFT